MPGTWINDGKSWSRMFSPNWAMEVLSDPNSSGCIGVLTYCGQIVCKVTASTIQDCERHIEERTRVYFAALLLDLDSTS